MKIAIRVLLLACLLAGCSPKPRPPAVEGVVLVIADGTSTELIAAARAYAHGATGRLAWDGFPNTAFVRTYSLSHVVTDSGAAATAMARGIKADNRVVGQAKVSSTSSPPSLLDLAKQAGWLTAVITDDSVTGGTPAPFLIEDSNRENHLRIAGKIIQQLGKRADIVVGGGSKWFQDETSHPDAIYQPGELSRAQQNGEALRNTPAHFFRDWDAFRSFHPPTGDLRPILATVDPNELRYYADGTRTLRLVDLVQKTVELLRERGKPFFLMVEAGLPDKACHLNQAKRAMVEVLEFDATLAWLKENLGQGVLLMATTDHNTGGLALNGYPPLKIRGDALLIDDPVTKRRVLTWASGPGAEPDLANMRSRIVFEDDKPWHQIREEIPETDPEYAQPATIPIPSALHTGGDVWLLGSGPGSESIRGSLDNTDIYRIISQAIKNPKGSSSPSSTSPTR